MNAVIHYVLDRAGRTPLPARLCEESRTITLEIDGECVVSAIRPANNKEKWFIHVQGRAEPIRISMKPDVKETMVQEAARAYGGVLTRLRRPFTG